MIPTYNYNIYLLTSRVCLLDLLDLLPEPDPLLDLLPVDPPLPAFDRLRWYRAYVVSHSAAVVVATTPLAMISEHARMVLDFIINVVLV